MKKMLNQNVATKVFISAQRHLTVSTITVLILTIRLQRLKHLVLLILKVITVNAAQTRFTLSGNYLGMKSLNW